MNLLEAEPDPNIRQIDIGEKMIKLDLYIMGFSKKMVDALLLNE